jgi:hypothetical protein
LVPVLDETPQELAIGQPGPVSVERRPAKVLDDLVHPGDRHRVSFAA